MITIQNSRAPQNSRNTKNVLIDTTMNAPSGVNSRKNTGRLQLLEFWLLRTLKQKDKWNESSQEIMVPWKASSPIGQILLVNKVG